MPRNCVYTTKQDNNTVFIYICSRLFHYLVYFILFYFVNLFCCCCCCFRCLRSAFIKCNLRVPRRTSHLFQFAFVCLVGWLSVCLLACLAFVLSIWLLAFLVLLGNAVPVIGVVDLFPFSSSSQSGFNAVPPLALHPDIFIRLA